MKKILLLTTLWTTVGLYAASPLSGELNQPLLACGGGEAFLVTPDGRTAWRHGNCGNIHRVWQHKEWVYYSNGELRRVDIVTGRDERVYKPADREGVFGFEVLKNGNLVVAENATGFITELDGTTLKPLVRFKGDPGPENINPHTRYRMIRKTPADTYLVCCAGAQRVREYDQTGRLVWEQETPALAFDCLRRANGNTLISHLTAVTEYTPDHKIAWQFTCEDAPELKLANLCGIQEQKNGRLVIGTYANGVEDGSRATAFEVTRDKKVVWRFTPARKRFSTMTAFVLPGWKWPVAWVQTTPQDEKKIENLVGTRLAATPVKPRRVLMVARAFGFCHNDALAYGNRAVEIAAARTGAFTVDCTTDVTILGDEQKLARYDAIVLNNCTGIRLHHVPGLEKTLTSFVRNGKGLCLIHAAVDSFFDSPTLADMNGGLFWGHPWTAYGTWQFKSEEPDHPLFASFQTDGPVFKRSDEIYMHKSPPYSRQNVRVLISLDLNDPATRDAYEKSLKRVGARHMRADRDFAVSWIRQYGSGRVFYTSFGHDRRAFLDKGRLHHILSGLQYCLGDLPCADTPRP